MRVCLGVYCQTSMQSADVRDSFASSALGVTLNLLR